MSVTKIRNATTALNLAAAIVGLLYPSHASATLVSSNINMAGPFRPERSAEAAISIFKCIGQLSARPVVHPHEHQLSASQQTVPLTFTPVNATNLPASGSMNMTYDNYTPGTPDSINSVGMDLTVPAPVTRIFLLR